MREISTLPYDERRVLVVAERAAGVPKPDSAATAWQAALLAAAKVLPDTAFGLAAGAVAVLIRARREMRRGGEKLLLVTIDEAQALHFPVGHPRRNVVYIGHPVDPSRYIPVADFHRWLLSTRSRRLCASSVLSGHALSRSCTSRGGTRRQASRWGPALLLLRVRRLTWVPPPSEGKSAVGRSSRP